MHLSVAQEDYLKAIWKMRESVEKVNIKSVADQLHVKPSTVASMFTYLVNASLVNYNKVSGAVLTRMGENVARKLIRKHRLVETFLGSVLQLQGDILHEEAEKLEHVISDQLMLYIDAFLNYPKTDPHGEEIPYLRKGEEQFKISELQTGQGFEIYKLNLNPEEMLYCKKHELNIGSRWSISEKTPGMNAFLISNGQKCVVLSKTLIDNIEVILNTFSNDINELD